MKFGEFLYSMKLHLAFELSHLFNSLEIFIKRCILNLSVFLPWHFRDRHSIATKKDKILCIFMIVLAVFSNVVAIYSDAFALFKKNASPRE